MRRSVSGPVEGSVTNTEQGEPGQTPGELRRFNTLQEAEAELEKALARGDRAYLLPPRPKWAGKR
jgi:hypothetical protein